MFQARGENELAVSKHPKEDCLLEISPRQLHILALEQSHAYLLEGLGSDVHEALEWPCPPWALSSCTMRLHCMILD